MYLPTSYRKVIRDGEQPTRDSSLKRNSDGVYRYLYNPRTAKKATQYLVRQGATPAQIRKFHMNPKNMGFYWIRAQQDPQAASDAMIASVNHNAKRILCTPERTNRIKEVVQTGEVVSQKRLIKAVDNPNDGRTRQDVQALALAGALTVTREKHGKCTWLLISIAASPESFDQAAGERGQALARDIAGKSYVNYAAVRARRNLSRCGSPWAPEPTPAYTLDLLDFA